MNREAKGSENWRYLHSLWVLVLLVGFGFLSYNQANKIEVLKAFSSWGLALFCIFYGIYRECDAPGNRGLKKWTFLLSCVVVFALFNVQVEYINTIIRHKMNGFKIIFPAAMFFVFAAIIPAFLLAFPRTRNLKAVTRLASLVLILLLLSLVSVLAIELWRCWSGIL